MEGTNYNLLIGKKVKVIFDDGSGITVKLGILQSIDSIFTVIINPLGNAEALPMPRVIRIEGE